MLVLVLGYVLLLKNNAIQEFIKIEANEKLIDFTSRLTTFFFISGGLFTYLKFFKGHLFLSKMIVKSSGQVVEIDKIKNLHVITIELINPGNYSILNPSVKVKYSNYPFDAEYQLKTVVDKTGLTKEKGNKVDFILRPGDEVSLIFKEEFNKTEIAIFYRIEVSKNTRTWFNELIMDNQLKK
ncbi:MAG: hypothetical protein IPH04_18840 [Saprospirales bacterium]|nr:hypothetical protein [Saprospirales bacterium]